MEGHKDPFNRRTYPWGQEDTELLTHYRALGALKRTHQALRRGGIQFFENSQGRLGFIRKFNGETLRIYINRSDESWNLSESSILFAHNLQGKTLMPMGFCITEAE